MDKVLIVDREEKYLREFEEYFRKLNQFEAITATDGRAALKILKEGEIAVLVTEMFLPDMGALDLLASMTRSHRNIPCVVMSEFGKPWFAEKGDGDHNLYYVAKPIEPVALSTAIVVALGLKDEGSSHDGFGLKSFLPLINMGSKSCKLEITSKGKNKGYLYFDQGLLVDAHYKGATPIKAVEEMIGWKGASLAISEVPKMRTQKRLHLEVNHLVGASVEDSDIDTSSSGAREPEPPFLDDAGLASDEEWIEKAKKPSFKKIVSELINSQLERYKTIKGYIAAGIVDSNFNVMSGDGLGEILDLQYPPLGLDSLFNFSSMLVKNSEANPCNMITLNTAGEIIQILRCETGNPGQVLYAVGITESSGNWQFLKHELEMIDKKLKDKVSEHRGAGKPSGGSPYTGGTFESRMAAAGA